jgi:hypothetical protein
MTIQKTTLVASERDHCNIVRRRAHWIKDQDCIDPSHPVLIDIDGSPRPSRCWRGVSLKNEAKTNMAPLAWSGAPWRAARGDGAARVPGAREYRHRCRSYRGAVVAQWTRRRRMLARVRRAGPGAARGRARPRNTARGRATSPTRPEERARPWTRVDSQERKAMYRTIHAAGVPLPLLPRRAPDPAPIEPLLAQANTHAAPDRRELPRHPPPGHHRDRAPRLSTRMRQRPHQRRTRPRSNPSRSIGRQRTINDC